MDVSLGNLVLGGWRLFEAGRLLTFSRREGATLLFSMTILDRLITASVTSHSNEERFAWLAPAISVGTPLREGQQRSIRLIPTLISLLSAN